MHPPPAWGAVGLAGTCSALFVWIRFRTWSVLRRYQGMEGVRIHQPTDPAQGR